MYESLIFIFFSRDVLKYPLSLVSDRNLQRFPSIHSKIFPKIISLIHRYLEICHLACFSGNYKKIFLGKSSSQSFASSSEIWNIDMAEKIFYACWSFCLHLFKRVLWNSLVHSKIRAWLVIPISSIMKFFIVSSTVYAFCSVVINCIWFILNAIIFIKLSSSSTLFLSILAGLLLVAAFL